MEGITLTSAPCPVSETVDVRLPLPQAFSVLGLTICGCSLLMSLMSLGMQQGSGTMFHPEPAPEWDAAAEGVDSRLGCLRDQAPQYGGPPQQAPPQQHYGYGSEYVPRAEFQQLSAASWRDPHGPPDETMTT